VVGTFGSFIMMFSDMFSWSNRCRPCMVLDNPQTSELALRSPARRKLFLKPVVARSKSNRWLGETYVLIKSSVVLLNPYTVMVSVSQSLFSVYLGMVTCGTSDLIAVMSPLPTVGELISLGL